MKKVMIFGIFMIGVVASAQTAKATSVKSVEKTALTEVQTSPSAKATVKKVNTGATKVEQTATQVEPETGNNKNVTKAKNASKSMKEATAVTL